MNRGRGVALQTFLKYSPSDADFKNMWVSGSSSTCSSVNQDTQTNRLFPLHSKDR